MYHALALMQPDSDLKLAAVVTKLKAKFPQVTVALTGDEILMTGDNDWDYHLLLQSGPDVLNESESLAGHIAGLDDDTVMRICDRRLEVWSDTPDPFMEHFDDHFQVLDVLRSFKGVILVDPREPALL